MFASKVDIQCQPKSCVEPCLLVRLTFNVNQCVKPDSGTTMLIFVLSSGNEFAPWGMCIYAGCEVDACPRNWVCHHCFVYLDRTVLGPSTNCSELPAFPERG
jgi:hypothetical protein